MDRKQLKALSWDQFIDKIWTILLLGFIYAAISGAAGGTIGSIIGLPVGVVTGIASLDIENPELLASILSLASSVSSIIASAIVIFFEYPFAFSFVMIFLGITNGKTPEVVDIFKGFKKYWRAIGVLLLPKPVCIALEPSLYNSGLYKILFLLNGTLHRRRTPRTFTA